MYNEKNHLAPMAAVGIAQELGVPKEGFGGKAVKGLTSKYYTDNVLIRARDRILSAMRSAGYGENVYGKLLTEMGLTHSQIPNRRYGKNYNDLFQKLWEFAYQFFIQIDRPDLAEQFAKNQPVYHDQGADTTYFTTLLKGAGSKPAVQAQVKRYSVLEPLAPAMRDALITRGMAAPSDLADLSQLFYNTFIAGKNNLERPIINFETEDPAIVMHLDESVVNAIVTYMNDLATRKEAGEVLPKTLDKMATATINTKEALTQKAQQQVAQEVGSTIVSNSKWFIIGILAVVVVIVVLIVRK